MPNDSDLIANALADAARAIHSPRSLDETLDAIVHAARETVPGFEHVGISVVRRSGEIETRAGTGPIVWDLDALQVELGEGPCLDAVNEDPVILVEQAADDDRWPTYLPRAVEKGLRAQLGLRLYNDDQTLGALNFYSTDAGRVDPDAVQIAELFATHAGIAIGCARQAHQLNESVSSRQVIGTAVGLMMERYQLTEDRAFQFLVRASTTSNIKLRAIAEGVVTAAEEKYGGQPGES
jgi:GAF domain-containing protein